MADKFLLMVLVLAVTVDVILSASHPLKDTKSREKSDLEDVEFAKLKSQHNALLKDKQFRNLNDKIIHQAQVIDKLNGDKKNEAIVNQKTAEKLKATEDKVDQLNQVNDELKKSLAEIKNSLEHEKKLRANFEKIKKKAEANLKHMQKAVADLKKTNEELDLQLVNEYKESAFLRGDLKDWQILADQLENEVKELKRKC